MSLSALVLERPGRWRIAGISAILALSIMPALPLLSAWPRSGLSSGTKGLPSFLKLLASSLAISLSGGLVALALGLGAGLFFSLYHYPGRRIFMFFFLLPVMVPPLLWSVGINNLESALPFMMPLFHGKGALVLVTVMITFPLVTLSTISACSGLNASQCQAVRLAAGEKRLFALACRFCLPAASVAATLGAFLLLASPGPALGLGVRTAISEILVSFSALYDMKLAAVQCLILSAAALLLVLVVLTLAGSRPVELLTSASRGMSPVHNRGMSLLAFLFSSNCALFLVVLPVYGLLIKAFSHPDFTALWSTLARTLPHTILYATGSAALACILGLSLAFFMGKFSYSRAAGMSGMLLIFSLPASLTALGLVYAGTSAPAWMDMLFRSPFAVCLAQGLHLFPVPALLGARFLASLPSSWSYCAETHGISLDRFVKKVIAPRATGMILTGFIMVLLLSEADVGTVLLLHPPGAQNLPLAIFTVMANAPSSLVSQLCLMYVMCASAFLLVVYSAWNRKEKWNRTADSY